MLELIVDTEGHWHPVDIPVCVCCDSGTEKREVWVDDGTEFIANADCDCGQIRIIGE